MHSTSSSSAEEEECAASMRTSIIDCGTMLAEGVPFTKGLGCKHVYFCHGLWYYVGGGYSLARKGGGASMRTSTIDYGSMLAKGSPFTKGGGASMRTSTTYCTFVRMFYPCSEKSIQKRSSAAAEEDFFFRSLLQNSTQGVR